MPQLSITKICLKIACLQFHGNFPGANELKRNVTKIAAPVMAAIMASSISNDLYKMREIM